MEVSTHEREKVQLKKKEIAIIRMIPVFHLLRHLWATYPPLDGSPAH